MTARGMSSKSVREWIGLVGVVGSLLFVGMEIRQNTAVARGQARQDLATQAQEWLTFLSQAETADLWARAWRLEEDLTTQELFRAELLMTNFLRRLENIYFQFAEGLVDEQALRGYGLQNLPFFMENRRWHWYWEERGWGDAFDPSFVAYIQAETSGPAG
jgi:hypothetical protein